MSGIETGADTWHDTLRSLRTGDKLNEANLRAPLQDIADGLVFLYNRTANPLGVGNRRRFKVNNPTELQALIGLAEGDIVRVGDQGDYVFHSDSAGQTTLGVRRYTITSGGIARALSYGHDGVNVAHGAAGLDAAAKVPSAQLRGHIAGVYSLPSTLGATGGATGTGSIVTITGPGTFIDIPNVVAGDIIVISSTVNVQNPTSTNFQQIFLNVVNMPADNSPSTVAAISFARIAGPGSGLQIPIAGMYVVTGSELGSGILRLRLQQQATTAEPIVFIPQRTEAVLHMRAI